MCRSQYIEPGALFLAIREGITLLFYLLTTYGGIVSAAYLDMGIDRLQAQGTNLCRLIVQTAIQKGKNT